MSAKIRYLKLAERHAKGRDDPQRQKLLRNFVNEAMALIEDGLERDGVVRIHEFGSFQLKWHKERRGRNPQTGERITIPGQYRVMFKPAKHVEERVNWPYLHLKPELLESPSLQAPAPVPPPRLEKPASPATSPALPLVMPAPPASLP